MKSGPATAAKIAFLIQGLDAPSTRVRILNLLPHFHDAGFSTTVEAYPNSLRGWFAVCGHPRGAKAAAEPAGSEVSPLADEAACVRFRRLGVAAQPAG
jgi:hypothetical protein